MLKAFMKEQSLGLGADAAAQRLVPLKRFLPRLILFRGFEFAVCGGFIEVLCNRATMDQFLKILTKQ